jgi:hypothetical protein
MTPQKIIQELKKHGVTLSLSPKGTLKVLGNKRAVNNWLPTIKELKAAIINELMATHAPSNILCKCGYRPPFCSCGYWIRPGYKSENTYE